MGSSEDIGRLRAPIDQRLWRNCKNEGKKKEWDEMKDGMEGLSEKRREDIREGFCGGRPGTGKGF